MTLENRGERAGQIRDSLRVLSRNAAARAPYIVSVLGHRFILTSDVFSPRFFRSTPLFTAALPIESGSRFLEIGCGSGITSVIAGLMGAQAVAVDINPAAVECTALNISLHGVADRVCALKSDVFRNIPLQQFDLIYWNLPFIYRRPNYRIRSMLERALFDPGYRTTRRFLRGARGYLASGGRLFVGFADFGEWDLLNIIAREYGFTPSITGTWASDEGGRVAFQLVELCPTLRRTRQ